MRRMPSRSEEGRGRRAAQVTLVTGVAVALVATAAAATGSGPAGTTPSGQRPPAAPVPAADAGGATGAIGAIGALPRGGSTTARFGPRTMAQGAAPDVSTELLAEPAQVRGGTPTALPAAVRTGPTFTALGRTGLSVSTAVGAWAPDGSRFAYRSGSVVYTVRADRTSRVLVKGKLNATSMAWGASGSRIVMAAATPGTATANLYAASPAGTGTAYMDRYLGPGVSAVTALRGDAFVVAYRGSTTQSSRLRLIRRSRGVWVTSFLWPSDPSASLPTTRLLDPVASPRQDRIAYRQQVPDTASPSGTADSIWVMNTNGSNARQVGAGQQLSKPVWSADGRTVYVLDRTASGRALVSFPAAGGTPTTLIPNVTAAGELYRRPASAGPVVTARATGRDGVASAVSGSRYVWGVPAARKASCDDGGAQAAVLIRSTSWVEAGPANALAIHTCGPLLVTGSARLDSRVVAELRRILPAGRTVHLVGSTSALSPSVEKSLRALRYRTVRYTGPDPYALSVAVAAKGWKDRDRKSVVLASAANHADGLIASVPGGYYGPVLLTNGTTMPKVVENYLVRHRLGAWAVGAQAHRAAPWATNLSGATTSDTSVIVARNFFNAVGLAVLVDSTAWRDGLGAGATAGRVGNPVLVTSPRAVPARLAGFLDASSGSLQVALVYGRSTSPSATVLRTVVVLGGGRFAY